MRLPLTQSIQKLVGKSSPIHTAEAAAAAATTGTLLFGLSSLAAAPVDRILPFLFIVSRTEHIHCLGDKVRKQIPLLLHIQYFWLQRLEMRESQCLYGRNASLPTVQQKGTRQKKRKKKNKTLAVVYHSDERPWKIYAPIYLNIISNWLRWMLTCIVDRHRRRVQMRPDDEGDNNPAPRELKTTSHQNKKGEMFIPPAYPSL